MDADLHHNRIGYLGLVLGALLAAGLLVGQARAEEPVDRHDILLLIDSSTSMDKVDPEPRRRLRFPLFLVRYLQAFAPPETEARVGVIVFATDRDIVVPLTPANEWSHGDYLDVQPFDCEQDDTLCYYTNFDDALALGATQLGRGDGAYQDPPCGQSPDGYRRRCDIVMFTDGIFWDSDADYPRESEPARMAVEQALDKLGKDIHVWIVMFGGAEADLGADHKAHLPESVAGWRELQGELELIDGFLPDASDLEPHSVYSHTLGNLGYAHDLASMKQKQVTSEDGDVTVSMTVPSFSRMLELTYLTDGLITETLRPEPDVKSGVQRWWLEEPIPEVEWTLNGDGLVYYRVLSESHDLTLQAQALPERQAVGRPVYLYAWLALDGGQVVTATDGLTVEVSVEPLGEMLPMTPTLSGVFSRTVVPTDAGQYTATFRVSQKLGTVAGSIEKVSRPFQAGYLPELSITAGEIVSATQLSIPVILSVKHFDQIAGLVTLTLYAGGREITTGLVWDGKESFRAQPELPLSGIIPFEAVLPAGETRSGLTYEEQRVHTQAVSRRIVEQATPAPLTPEPTSTPEPEPVPPPFPWLTIVVTVLSVAIPILVLIAVAWWLGTRRQKQRQAAQRTAVATILDPEASADEIRDARKRFVGMRVAQLWPMAEQIGVPIAELVRRKLD